MTWTSRLLFAAAALAMTSAPASAGKIQPGNVVQISGNASSGTVHGALGSTRNASGGQFLGCWTQWDDTFGIIAGCLAGGIPGKPTVSCIFPVGAMPIYVLTLAHANPDSYIELQYEPFSAAGGRCPPAIPPTLDVNPMPTSCCKYLNVQSYSYDETKQ